MADGLPPADALRRGAEVLGRVLVSKGFTFHFLGEGKGSGRTFARGEFVREDRRLEVHFRWSLGLVRYHVGNQSASHESYMRELGVWSQCRYPNVSEDSIDAFHSLAHDLDFAEDFLSGSAAFLIQAAEKERLSTESREREAMAGYVGDKSKLEDLSRSFREGRYKEVVKLAKSLKYPDRMTESQRRKVETASRRIRISPKS